MFGPNENNNNPGPDEQANPEERDELRELLKSSFQIILTGAPGTGKTYRAVQLAEEWIADTEGSSEENLCKVQFHPGYEAPLARHETKPDGFIFLRGKKRRKV